MPSRAQREVVVGRPTSVDRDSTGNRIASDGVYDYEYDLEGNRTAKETIANGEREEYEYDYRNRLTQVTFKDQYDAVVKTVAYSYDLFNRQTQRTLDPDGPGGASATDQFFIQDGGNISLEFDGTAAGDVAHHYLWGPDRNQFLADEPIVNTSTPGTTQWALTDSMGSVTDLITQSGGGGASFVGEDAYSSFGELMSHSGVSGSIGFSGDQLDSITGLYQNEGSSYDPRVGEALNSNDGSTTFVQVGGGPPFFIPNTNIRARPWTLPRSGKPLDWLTEPKPYLERTPPIEEERPFLERLPPVDDLEGELGQAAQGCARNGVALLPFGVGAPLPGEFQFFKEVTMSPLDVKLSDAELRALRLTPELLAAAGEEKNLLDPAVWEGRGGDFKEFKRAAVEVFRKALIRYGRDDLLPKLNDLLRGQAPPDGKEACGIGDEFNIGSMKWKLNGSINFSEIKFGVEVLW